MTDEPKEKPPTDPIRQSFFEAIREGTMQTERDGFMVYHTWPVKVKNPRSHVVITVKN